MATISQAHVQYMVSAFCRQYDFYTSVFRSLDMIDEHRNIRPNVNFPLLVFVVAVMDWESSHQFGSWTGAVPMCHHVKRIFGVIPLTKSGREYKNFNSFTQSMQGQIERLCDRSMVYQGNSVFVNEPLDWENGQVGMRWQLRHNF
jgi:hypothetical protein